MSKTWLITPSFCKADLLHDFLKHIYKNGPLNYEHVIIDNHYPVDYPHNSERIKALAQIYKCTYVDSGYDRGLHGGLNNAIAEVGIKREDLIVGCDPDDRPTSGFVEAIEKVLKADPSLAVVALNFWVIPWRLEQPDQAKLFHVENIAGEEILIRQAIEMWTVAGFNYSFIHDTGGFSQPYAYYGGLEHDLYVRWHQKNMRYGYLKHHFADEVKLDREDPKLFDKAYRDWKTAHVGGDARSFKEFLDVSSGEGV